MMRRCGKPSKASKWRCSASRPVDAEDTYTPRLWAQAGSFSPTSGSCCSTWGWRPSRRGCRGKGRSFQAGKQTATMLHRLLTPTMATPRLHHLLLGSPVAALHHLLPTCTTARLHPVLRLRSSTWFDTWRSWRLFRSTCVRKFSFVLLSCWRLLLSYRCGRLSP